MTKLYHCGIVTDREEGDPMYPWKKVEMLCGADQEPGAFQWDPVHIFVTGRFAQIDEPCPACLNHPDLALHILGEL